MARSKPSRMAVRMRRMTIKAVLETAVELEKKTMALYTLFMRAFKTPSDVRRFWFNMARHEAGHCGALTLVESVLGEAPLSGHIFLFANATRTRLKVLVWDGSGLWICSKRLERGRYAWPAWIEGEGRRVVMNQSELALLLSGVDLERTRRREWWRRE